VNVRSSHSPPQLYYAPMGVFGQANEKNSKILFKCCQGNILFDKFAVKNEMAAFVASGIAPGINKRLQVS
jgi:hypothetical protein